MAGSIAELARDMLARDYDMRLKRARIVLIEAGARVLEAFPPDLSQNAADALADLGVDIRTGTRVTRIESGVVHLGKESIPTQTVIWTAGTTATPVADWLGVAPGHGGRVPVDAALRVAAQPAIHVIGDAALAVDAHGKPLPGLAPVAKQQGAYVARAILRRLRGRFHTGTTATSPPSAGTRRSRSSGLCTSPVSPPGSPGRRPTSSSSSASATG